METKLYLEFLTPSGAQMSLSLNDPKAELTREEIEAQMAQIIGSNIFNIKGEALSEIKGAYKVEQTKTSFIGE